MQPVADLKFFQLAQVIIDLAEGRIVSVFVCDADIHIEPDGSAERKDFPRQRRQPPRVHAGRLVIFVHQLFKVSERAIAFGPGQRRGQMIDDHRLGAVLGLRAFARIIDDKGIEMGNRP